MSDWAAAVLCGGESRRMGQDKATLSHHGEPLAGRVARALLRAGANEVVFVGGSLALDARGLGEGFPEGAVGVVGDDWPGEGPLGGVLTALRHLAENRASCQAAPPRNRRAQPEIVFVASCDLVRPDPAAMIATVKALVEDADAEVAVPLDRSRRPQWLHAAWRVPVRATLAGQFDAGERAIHRAVEAAGMAVVELDTIEDAVLKDADTPEDLLG